MTEVLILASPVGIGAVFSLGRYLSARWRVTHLFSLSHRYVILGRVSVLGVVLVIATTRVNVDDSMYVELQDRSGLNRWSLPSCVVMVGLSGGAWGEFWVGLTGSYLHTFSRNFAPDGW